MSLWGNLSSFIIGTSNIGACFKIDTSGNTQIVNDLTVNGNINNSALSTVSTNAANALQGYNSIINILKTVYFTYPLYNGSVSQYYRLDTLNLPQGGHQAEIKVNLCYGYNISSGISARQYKIQNYQLSINIYSSNGYRLPNPGTQIPYLGSSRTEDSNSFVNGTLPSVYGIFYSGFVNAISPFTTPLGVYMGTTSDPLNKVDIWIQSYPWHGQPLVQVSQTTGSFSYNFSQQFALPNTGLIKLDMIQCTPTFLYKNINNLGN